MRVVPVTAVLCTGLVAGTTASAPVPDRVAAVPSTQVLVENDCVRVRYHDVAVGQPVPTHAPRASIDVLRSNRAG